MTYLFVTRRSWSMLADDALNMPITVFILRAINIPKCTDKQQHIISLVSMDKHV
jgi:hypothetical protein